MTAPRFISRPKKVTVIINPAAGKPKPILHLLNEQLADIDWKVEVTRKQGDANEFTRRAVAESSEIILSYGGDGTLMEIVDGVVGTDVPVLILQGGTGNLVASELGIPHQIEAALEIIKTPQVKLVPVDLGVVNDSFHFILRCGCGLEAETLIRTESGAKSQLGKLAYVQGLFKALAEQETIKFRIWLNDDPEPIITSGVTLTIANAGRIGWGELKVTPNARIDDGLFDVCLIKKTALQSAVEFVRIAQNLARSEHGFTSDATVQYQQAYKVRVETDHPVTFQADGDIVGETPFQVSMAKTPLWVAVPG
ncbi:MAG: diacylglycerol kinase family lipid kinase [Verrucomicrobiales bacterium]|nr:diacylglycerol kinase family lipid kinase [Verrucomicrobiales bacterium]